MQDTAAHDSAAAAATKDREQFLFFLYDLLSSPGNAAEHTTVMYILMDNFIRIRDEIGIMNSEKVMYDVADIIRNNCDECDIMTRFGDCTFAVQSTGTDTDATRDKAEKIRADVEKEIFEVAGHSVLATTSIGICSASDNDDNAEMTIARADHACEAARTSGGNQVLTGSTVTDGVGVIGQRGGHPEFVSNILNKDRIKIYYQPISSLKGMKSFCYEALTGIVDDEGNILLPGEQNQ